MAEPTPAPDAGETPAPARTTVAVLGIHFFGVALGFGLQVLLARGLGAGAYGVYVYALRWLGLLALLCQGGLALGALRFVPEYLATGAWRQLAGFLKAGVTYVLLSWAVVFSFALGTTAALGQRLGPDFGLTLQLALLGLPLYALLQIWSSALRGLGRVVLSQLAAPVVRPIVLGLAIVLWLAFDQPLIAASAMVLNLIAAAAVLALAGIWLWRALPPPVRQAEPRYRREVWIRVMPPLMVQNLIGMALQRLDVLMIGIVLGVREVALYAVASRVAGLLVFGRKSVNAWAAPRIAGLHAAGRAGDLAILVRQAARGIALASLPIAAVVALAGPHVLAAFGREFAAAWAPLLILTAGHCLAALLGPASFLLSMTGAERTVVRVSAVVLLASGALYLTLIPAYGLAGAAAAAAISRWLHHAALAVAAWKRTGIRTTIL